jgi:glycosyltransferase involved in cell wall biosynthesis
MAKQKKTPTTASTTDGAVRPVLVVNEEILNNLSVFLQYFFVGLADESGTAALICPPDYEIDHLLYPSVEIIKHPAYQTPLLWQQSKRKLLDSLMKYRPNILHCFGDGMANFTRNLAEQLDLPYVITLSSFQNKLRKSSISAKHCAAIIAPTEILRMHFEQLYPKFGERIRKINMGTFVDSQCACFSVPSRITSIVVVRRLDNAEDLGAMLSAIKHLAIDGHEFILMLIGTGPAERDVRDLRKTLGLSQVVYIIPDIQPLRSVFASADIFVLPQPERVFSYFLMEAMSTGMAVAGCAGGVDDVLIDNQTASLFEPADELSIYGCLQQLMEKREFARQIAMGAQSHLKENYAVSKMVTSLLETYRSARQWYKSQSAQSNKP